MIRIHFKKGLTKNKNFIDIYIILNLTVLRKQKLLKAYFIRLFGVFVCPKKCVRFTNF